MARLAQHDYLHCRLDDCKDCKIHENEERLRQVIHRVRVTERGKVEALKALVEQRKQR